MQHAIHPVSAPTLFECANCGTHITVESTQPATAKLDTCSNCHPAYTGVEVRKASGSRVDAFSERYKRVK